MSKHVEFLTLVANFEEAVREHENMGSQRPEDHYCIQHHYEIALKALLDFNKE